MQKRRVGSARDPLANAAEKAYGGGMFTPVPIDESHSLPVWRRPLTLLFLMAIAMPIAFNGWWALLNNFIIEVGGFNGADNGLLHTVREIPGFLAVGVIFLIIFIREQVLGLVSLITLGVATALTAQFPQYGGILLLTLLSSIGFHNYETVNQSLQLQWLPKDKAPQTLGWLIAAGSAVTFVVYAIITLLWDTWNLSYNSVFMVSGGLTAVIAAFALLAYPQFEAPTKQAKKMILRKRYWLYYALQFMSGARRQIFMVFAAFMMVEKFGFEVHEVTTLYLVNLLVNVFAAPVIGKVVQRFGERMALGVEYVGLVLIFLAYGGVYYMGWGFMVAAALYVLDHIFFGRRWH